jgi:hypothetical protein
VLLLVVPSEREPAGCCARLSRRSGTMRRIADA